MKNLRANYVPRALCGRRVVYSKVVRHGNIEEIAGLYSRKYKIRPGYQKKAIEKVEERRKREEEERRKREEGEQVEVSGLVGVYYDGDFFHAELLFKWWGRRGFNEERLLDEAVQILLSELPNIERISFELVTSPNMYEDVKVRGISDIQPYSGQNRDEMDYEIFIPKAGTRVLWTDRARVTA